MKKLIQKLFTAFVLLYVGFGAYAADVPMGWDLVPGAHNYIVERSVDGGETWTDPQITGSGGEYVYTEGAEGSYTYTGVPEDGLVLFRIGSQSAGATPVNYMRLYSGAWYNHLLMPLPTPGGHGIN